jgi:hypothetical protein
MRQTTFIYCLEDPRSGRVFYIGKSNNPRKRESGRWNADIEARRAKILAEGFSLRPRILEEVQAANWVASEKKWIRRFRSRGAHLLNRNAGGSGVLEHTSQTRARLSRVNSGKPKPPFTAEHKRRLSESHKGQFVSQERRLIASRFHSGRSYSLATRKRLSRLAKCRWKNKAFADSQRLNFRRLSAILRVLTDQDVSEIRRLRSVGWKLAGLSDEYDVSQATISNVINGKHSYRK